MNIINDKIYIFGGLGDANSIVDDLIMFDLSSIDNENIKVTIVVKKVDKKIARYGHCSCQYQNNKLLFIGGCNKDTDFFSNHYEFDLKTKKFNERNDLQVFSNISNKLPLSLIENQKMEENEINCCDTSLPVFSTIILLNETDNLSFYSYGGKINKSKVGKAIFNLQNFEEKLNSDEKKLILSFLDISSLCKLNCVSKSFSLSQFSNDDQFWKERFTNVIKEYNNPMDVNIYYSYYKQQQMSKEIQNRINTILQSTKNDYKNAIIKFVGEIFEQAKIDQKKRLSKMNFNNDTVLCDKETILKKASWLLEGHKHGEYSDCKVVAVGDGAVGKTCLLLVLSGSLENIKNLEYIPTVFDNYNMQVSFDTNETYVIGLWDTAGPEEYDRLRPLSYPMTDVFLLCFSVVNEWSFNNVTTKWVPELNHHCPNTPILLCGTKVDLRENKKMLYNFVKSGNVPYSKEEGEALAKQIGAIAYIETSSLERIGFEKLGEYIMLLSKAGKQPEELKNKKKCLVQ
ncbi:hypothetical protein ABK040_012314 [Willaertia magna]